MADRPVDAPDAAALPSPGRSPLPVTGWYGYLMSRVTLYALAAISLLVIYAAQWMYITHPGQMGTLLLGAAIVVAVLTAVWRRREWFLAPGEGRWIAGVVFVALLLRLVAVLALPYLPVDDWAVYHGAAVSFARTGQIGVGAKHGAPQYRCFLPPAQIATLGVLYRLFGPHLLAGQLLNCLLGSATVAGVYYLARRVGGVLVARVVSVLVAILPSAVLACLLQGAEVPQTFWMVAALCVYVAWVDRRLHWGGALGCGVLWGLAALIRPTFVLMPVVLGLHVLLAWNGRRRRALAAAAVMAVGTAAVVAPWTYRNYRVTGGFVLISSNSGLNLYSANNPDARGDYTQSAAEYVFERADNDLELQQVGREKAIEWIRANPRRFAELAVWKFAIFWWWDKDIAWWSLTHPAERHLEAVADRPAEVDRSLTSAGAWGPYVESFATGFYAAVVVAALAGVWRRRRFLAADRTWLFIPLLCMYFTAVHMVFEAQAKYHYSLVGLLCILAAMAVGGWLNRPEPREPSATASGG
ncbi:MAG: ArnT family glycosyltransferase [Phycisphaerae bacterium]